jgi:hypothetical protein
MSKYKTGDWVYFWDCQVEGQVININEDGTYLVEWGKGNNSGTMTVTEDDMELAEKPDYRHIPMMYINSYDDKVCESLNEMKRRYRNMTSGDLQTAIIFSNIFKELNIEDKIRL